MKLKLQLSQTTLFRVVPVGATELESLGVLFFIDNVCFLQPTLHKLCQCCVRPIAASIVYQQLVVDSRSHEGDSKVLF